MFHQAGAAFVAAAVGVQPVVKSGWEQNGLRGAERALVLHQVLVGSAMVFRVLMDIDNRFPRGIFGGGSGSKCGAGQGEQGRPGQKISPGMFHAADYDPPGFRCR